MLHQIIPENDDPEDTDCCTCDGNGCTYMTCECRIEGASCTSLCACAKPYWTCHSPFTQLPRAFEKLPDTTGRLASGSWSITRANPCFKKYINFGFTGQGEMDVNSLKVRIMADSEAWRKDGWLAILRTRLHGETRDEQEKTLLWASLMEYALGNGNLKSKRGTDIKMAQKAPGSQVWSFCRDRWVTRANCRHCGECDVCYENAWHCWVCGICKVGHWFACDGCGAYSPSGAKYGVVKGRMAKDAHTTQGGLSTDRLKRARQAGPHQGIDSISEVS